ncbi:serine/threonine protein phosphatase PrpC [Breznakia sp. PF5-3]|uniref:Stp1/IreP family PP2C-type Ser/Thr phosphatase n=1 Tax=unclassified Breznakia TaxID=2623764 RepID=UPI0024074784|nr:MULTISPECIES: Stp1/IreP family PP2C-type Ser/Thr phosphatase [unclassified Breznakia]MDL2276432.1 Stp1/IreP family PP2C-type Ser/Thr phosphatase [Breznakia sp. OttesenSCG-928-G09]MDF9825583.1 serine/threonine protein phosphatase PrpC [Breznakia sp. PM6-1]MDF9836426.1 serine/threonine protein phosphatase PrpC [Breznakia sp. PF5-3]MDF9838566.1 serine/threonine protein phosphatase PrpC [Breznakia sp. PFB2-8]MDF9860587.1 serine/threonine protein phosphatase PrpC [Breznakia sp. PH5-24]
MIIYGLSDTGLIRKQNQDSYYYSTNVNGESFAIVCDGIGGGNAGDVASQLAKDSLAKSFIEKPVLKSDQKNREWILDAINKANDEVFTQSTKSKELKGMGTTLAGVLFTADATFIFHCGDSRVYAIYEDLISLTEDHNFAADLVSAGEITASEASLHPRGGMLTKALGIWNEVEPTINKIKESYKALLVCSDGLHGFVSSSIIKNILEQNWSIEEKVKELIKASENAGGFDNVTVIIAEKEGY